MFSKITINKFISKINTTFQIDVERLQELLKEICESNETVRVKGESCQYIKRTGIRCNTVPKKDSDNFCHRHKPNPKGSVERTPEGHSSSDKSDVKSIQPVSEPQIVEPQVVVETPEQRRERIIKEDEEIQRLRRLEGANEDKKQYHLQKGAVFKDLVEMFQNHPYLKECPCESHQEVMTEYDRSNSNPVLDCSVQMNRRDVGFMKLLIVDLISQGDTKGWRCPELESIEIMEGSESFLKKTHKVFGGFAFVDIVGHFQKTLPHWSGLERARPKYMRSRTFQIYKQAYNEIFNIEILTRENIELCYRIPEYDGRLLLLMITYRSLWIFTWGDFKCREVLKPNELLYIKSMMVKSVMPLFDKNENHTPPDYLNPDFFK